MRNFLFTGAYWGVILVLIGLGYIYNTIANKNLPVFRIAVGVVILSIGIQIIYSTFNPKNSHLVLFKGKNISHTLSGDYSVVFGSSVIDLTDIDLTQGDVRKSIEVVFGGVEVYIPRNVQIEIKSETVFGSTDSPFGNSQGFGDRSFTQSAQADSLGKLTIRSECVFGSVEFKYKKQQQAEAEF
jgi:predicted membrane protein